MGSHIFIDGYNLLWASDRHRPEAIRHFEDSREHLIARLAAHPRLARHQVTIVFDAHKTDALEGSIEQRGNLNIQYTRSGQSADAVLRQHSQEYGSSAVIISSDREVARDAEKKGCGVLGSHEFDRLLNQSMTDAFGEDDDEETHTPRSKKGPARRDPKARRRALARLRL